jgi:hypothetical protein
MLTAPALLVFAYARSLSHVCYVVLNFAADVISAVELNAGGYYLLRLCLPLSFCCISVSFLNLAADVISAVEFNADGSYLATGDKGGRVVLFEKVASQAVSL